MSATVILTNSQQPASVTSPTQIGVPVTLTSDSEAQGLVAAGYAV